jgi:hypothetical protein
MMPTKTSAGPNEVVRLEVLRLAPPLLSSKAIKKYEQVFFWPFWAEGVICSSKTYRPGGES